MMARGIEEMMTNKPEDKLELYIAHARADQLEAELIESKAALEPLQETITMLRRQRDHWQHIAEKEHWPFEWQAATKLKEQRDSARHMLGLAEAKADNLEAMVERLGIERDNARMEVERTKRQRDYFWHARDETWVERDEAMAEVKQLKAAANMLVTEGNQARERIGKVEAERDAARRLTNKWKEIVDKVAIWGDRLKRDRDEARRLACRMLAERDGAVEALRKDRVDKPRAMAAAKRLIAFTKRMIAERNEARDARDDWRKVAFQIAKQRRDAQDDADRWKCHATAAMGDMPNPDPGRLMREKRREKQDDLQPCGHPRSAVVTARDLGGPGTCYCGACAEEGK